MTDDDKCYSPEGGWVRPLTEGNKLHAKKPTPPKGRVFKEGEYPKPIAPPPAGAPAMHYGTNRKASELSERGFRLEGYIMRDEIGDVALIHCGRVVWLTPDEMDAILVPNPNFKGKYSDEEN